MGFYFDLMTAFALELLDLCIVPTARTLGIGDVFKVHAVRGYNELAVEPGSCSRVRDVGFES